MELIWRTGRVLNKLDKVLVFVIATRHCGNKWDEWCRDLIAHFAGSLMVTTSGVRISSYYCNRAYKACGLKHLSGKCGGVNGA